MGQRPLLRRATVPAGASLLLAVLAAACGPAATPPARSGVRTTPTAAASIPATAPTTTPTTAVPAFSSAPSPVTAADLGATWHAGCPVAPSQLVELRLRYWGFDGASHLGAIVVNTTVAAAVSRVFSILYAARFPILEMVPVSVYGGNDDAAAAADDTSGFNCRDAVAAGPPHWSEHAYGEAIDVNDLENPYIDGTTIIPPTGVAYTNRSDVRPGMAVTGGVLVRTFMSIGWGWGGSWTGAVDYQHFSVNGH